MSQHRAASQFLKHVNMFLFICCLFPVQQSKADASSSYQLAMLEPSVLDDPSLKWRMKRQDAQRTTAAKIMTWVDDTHAEWSEDISYLGSYLDQLMGGTDQAQEENKSYLKIDLDLYHSKFEDTEFEPKVRFRLDLPVLKEQLRLVFESEPDQAKDLGERKLGASPTSQTSPTNDDIYASFRYWIEAEKWTSLSFDSGVRVRARPDIFTRARGVRSWALKDLWSFRFSQELFWFESRGLGTQTQLDFERPLSERFLFRKTIALDWSERDARYDLINQFSLFHNYNEITAFQYSIGMQSDYQRNQALSRNYFAHFTLRSRLYKEWLYYQFNTGVEYAREFQFKANPFLTIRLEILFSDDAGKKLHAALH